MSSRRLCTEAQAILAGFNRPEHAERRRVLRETIAAFEHAAPPDRFHRLARRNLRRWQAESRVPNGPLRIRVLQSDWGDATLALTAEYGRRFAVLNMANAYVPGGAYPEGAAAQEENMFRRTDCHFRVCDPGYDSWPDRYTFAVTALLSARDGAVYLDTRRPRVCVRGSEDRSRPDLGYAWLPEHQVFSFLELRAAAQDLRDGSAFDPQEARKRIAAQLDTLRANAVRYAVLGASGCGAFRNPADQVALIYREEIASRAADFSVIAFAIHGSGYGPDNYTPFARMFGDRQALL